ncbi:hypothetical protein Taro_027863 [Colocasia esculenta]|uniref:Amino acid transporter transmembrane domain-containing protein n=1 Tax=Colocasia esculenta TaxID=4460 RepID=A0A843VVJ4_COLES|nr:hypothetical protein [Colocasia esculenta]
MGGEEEQKAPLLSWPHGAASEQQPADDDHSDRTGTLWTTMAHIMTGVIGSGVLSLAWSVAQLGWLAGPLCMLFLAAATLLPSSILADCYRYPDPEHGHIRNSTYMQAVKLFLGSKGLQ